VNAIELPEALLLSAEDEVELARRIEAGVFAEHLIPRCPDWTTPGALMAVVDDGTQAWQHFYTANLRLAALVAHRTARRFQVDADDIIQECCLSLGRAIMAWDYMRGTRFSTLAWPRLAFAARHACLCLTKSVRCTQRWLSAVNASLHGAVEDDSADAVEMVLAQLIHLGAEERQVVEARFGLRSGKPLSYALIANQMDTSPYHVKRIESTALEQLGSMVAELV